MEDQGEMVQMPLRGATAEHQTGSDGENQEQQPMQPEHQVVVLSDSKKDKSGDDRCACCPPICYSNNCVMVNSVFTCFAMVISMGILVGLTVTMARPHLNALTYVDGTCTTVTSNYTGVRERCACGGRFCAADYPCLEITVEYEGKNGELIESMLHDEEHVFTYRSHCSYQPESCRDGKNDLIVDLYKHRWGVAGKEFPCFHNPNGQGALRRRTRSISFILTIILVPAACAILSTVLCCVVYCYCCPRSRVHKFNVKE